MLSESALFIIVIICALLVIGYFSYQKYRYKQAVNKPFPSGFKEILEQRLPVYSKLSLALQQNLHRHILHFLYHKQFVGCNGLVITDEIRVVIAAEACLLILNRPSSCYQNLKWIYVYPSVFIAQREEKNEYGLVSNERRHLLGESWQNGKVILAWDNVESGMQNFHDGQNVVLHEFAHQLDQESGSANGAPLLYTKDSYKVWSQVFNKEFQQLQAQVYLLDEHSHAKKSKSHLIDKYGATNPAEFFAVVTEVFFEKPHALQKLHPELFDLLKSYYQLDPNAWQ